MKNRFFIFILSFIFLFSSTINQASVWEQEIYWDWSKIALSDDVFWQTLIFPNGFQIGGAQSAFQSEGVQTYDKQFVENNWTQDSILGKYYKNNIGSDHWNRYKEDVQLLKNLGLNAYRFSIAWEKIEPVEGEFDQRAIDHYRDFAKELKNNGIEPWICLFHFTMPTWFADKGGFEKKENTKFFVRFCTYIFEQLHETVDYWASYNEPVAYAIEGYLRGTFPPHKKNFLTAGSVLKNMLNAHVVLYHNLKEIAPNAQIGVIKMFHPLEPYSWWNPLEKLTAGIGNYVMHDTVLNFFKHGIFNWLYVVQDINPGAIGTLDFIGVNYYCHEIIKVGLSQIGILKARDFEERAPDNNKAIYPEGLYRAIVKAAELRVPIFVTENGIADATDIMRNEFIKKHLYVVQYACDNGYDVRGYHYWTPIDSNGWKKNYTSKYGFYAVDSETKERSLRNGAQPFFNFLNQHKKQEFQHVT
jgi:beta-glucosidase